MSDPKQIARYEYWVETLQDKGYRLTEPRQVVMEIIVCSDTALTPQDIYDLAREAGHSLGIASVYRTLETLEDLDLIQQVHHPQGCQAYWPKLVGHKHLVICKRCGRMEDFPGADDLSDLFAKVEQSSGYWVQDHWLQLFGLCQECQKN